MPVRMRTFALAFCCLSVVSRIAFAECDLDDVVGYTLVDKKTVVGYIEDGKREDGYTGCSYGRILVFQDGTGVSCADYNYDYAYRPDAYIFMSGSSIKVCIDDEMIDVRRLR